MSNMMSQKMSVMMTEDNCRKLKMSPMVSFKNVSDDARKDATIIRLTTMMSYNALLRYNYQP